MIALMLLGQAQAYELTGWVWDSDQMPITFVQTEYNEDSLPQTANDDGLIYQEEVIIKGFCNWHWNSYCDEANLDSRFIETPDAGCAELLFEYQGREAGNEGNNNDGTTKIYWDDPTDIQGAGVNAVTYTIASQEYVKTVDGVSLYSVTDSDITFNDDIDWSPDWEIMEGCQGDERSVESTGTHEIGHLLGMAHSCEQGDTCVDTTLQEATMFWTGGSCDTSRSGINSDDIAGMHALYGPYLSFDVTDDTVRFGPVPLEGCLTLDGEDETLASVYDLSVNWGDGTIDTTSPSGDLSSDDEFCHTYETQGQFNVNVDVAGSFEACGDWDLNRIQRALFLVCDVPIPAFEVEHYDGLSYTMINNTDVSVFGCIDGIQWDVYKGGSVSGEPIISVGAWGPRIELPEEGKYTIQLTAQGPAGEDTFEHTFDAEDKRGEVTGGCSSLGGSAGFGAGALALLGLVALGRRRD